MKLNVEIKSLIEKYWHDNTRVSSNARDVLKLRVGSKVRNPHPKHLLDTTQTEFYRKFCSDSVLPGNIKINQRSFEKCKPWYVKINKQQISCCCKIHVQFRYFYDVFRYIHCTLHTNMIIQECGIDMPPESIREFISSLFCEKSNDRLFYLSSFISGQCINCENLSFLRN